MIAIHLCRLADRTERANSNSHDTLNVRPEKENNKLATTQDISALHLRATAEQCGFR